jgi:GH15 family glucan-1,4-alpha-glucosidase
VGDLDPYPSIGEYALIGDCRSAALVSRAGSIDWCCMPRVDHGSCFARLLDWDGGGYCSLAPVGDIHVSRRYVAGTLVLETRFSGEAGEGRLWDLFAIDGEAAQLLRIVEVARGQLEFDLRIVPRFDYGELEPWLRSHGHGVFSATGGDDALVIAGDCALQPDKHELDGRICLRAGERARLSIAFCSPELLDRQSPQAPTATALDGALEETIGWWRRWASQSRFDGPEKEAVLRSAIVLKALSNRDTGAIAAAPTTSLPEAPGGWLNWDYRFSWIRDSAFSVRALGEVGFHAEADAFRRFVERSAAGSADGLQIMYGVGGERRLTELTVDGLEGYRGAAPVRVGNAAAEQVQLDVYGELLNLAWRWHERGHTADDDYWRFLLDVVEAAAAHWEQPDRGIWEIRGEPREFVYSKAMCWAALDRGIALAEQSQRQAPLERWRTVRARIRRTIERDGYDSRRGIFVQSFGSEELDAALLLLPGIGFLDWDDERMLRTTDAIREALEVDGLLLRYRPDARMQGDDSGSTREGTFLACSFWLAECLARQGRHDDARAVFERCAACGNDLGLFAEEYDTTEGEMLGNYPQGLTHLAHISAAAALAAATPSDVAR